MKEYVNKECRIIELFCFEYIPNIDIRYFDENKYLPIYMYSDQFNTFLQLSVTRYEMFYEKDFNSKFDVYFNFP